MIVPNPSSPTRLSPREPAPSPGSHIDGSVKEAMALGLLIFIIALLAFTCVWYKNCLLSRSRHPSRPHQPNPTTASVLEHYHIAHVTLPYENDTSTIVGSTSIIGTHEEFDGKLSMVDITLSEPPAAHVRPA